MESGGSAPEDVQLSIRVVVADDHVMIRQGIAALIDAEADMAVVGQARDGREAIEMVAAHQPDIVVLDISMSGLGGLPTTHAIVERYPATKVVIVSLHEEPPIIRQLLNAGAQGYVLKRSATQDLTQAIRIVVQGGLFLAPGVTLAAGFDLHDVLSNPSSAEPPLSEREEVVLKRIAQGYTNQEIADDLGLSVKSIETYKARAYQKLGLGSRVDLMRYARQHGWLEIA